MKVEIGTASRPHGIKGACIVKLINKSSKTLKKGLKVYLSSLDGFKMEAEIDFMNYGTKNVMGLKGVNNRNQIEATLPFSIAVDEQHLATLGEDEFYYKDLINMEVREVGSDLILGKVTDVYDNGAQSVLSVHGSEGFDIPIVDHFVPQIDYPRKRVWVHRPEYL